MVKYSSITLNVNSRLIILAKTFFRKTVDDATGELINTGSYSSNTGLVGTTFTKVKPIYGYYEAYKDTFKPIDYSSRVKFIVNFLFVPVYGYNTEVVGVLKLFNRKDKLPSANEINELELYQKSIGLMVRQIEDLKNTKSTLITIKKMLNCIERAESTVALLLIYRKIQSTLNLTNNCTYLFF